MATTMNDELKTTREHSRVLQCTQTFFFCKKQQALLNRSIKHPGIPGAFHEHQKRLRNRRELSGKQVAQRGAKKHQQKERTTKRPSWKTRSYEDNSGMLKITGVCPKPQWVRQKTRISLDEQETLKTNRTQSEASQVLHKNKWVSKITKDPGGLAKATWENHVFLGTMGCYLFHKKALTKIIA